MEVIKFFFLFFILRVQNKEIKTKNQKNKETKAKIEAKPLPHPPLKMMHGPQCMRTKHGMQLNGGRKENRVPNAPPT